MTQKDQMKLLEAGYRIIRRDYTRMVLKQKTTHRYDWHNASAVFTTKVALNELASPAAAEASVR